VLLVGSASQTKSASSHPLSAPSPPPALKLMAFGDSILKRRWMFDRTRAVVRMHVTFDSARVISVTFEAPRYHASASSLRGRTREEAKERGIAVVRVESHLTIATVSAHFLCSAIGGKGWHSRTCSFNTVHPRAVAAVAITAPRGRMACFACCRKTAVSRLALDPQK